MLALDSVAHLKAPWGEPVSDLEELHQRLAEAPASVLFMHVLHVHLRHAGTETLPTDDLSAWVANTLQEPEAAERLSFAAQPPFTGAEGVRARMRDVLGGMSEKRRTRRRAPEGAAFMLLSATSVRFPIGIELSDPRELKEALARAGIATWFLYLLEEPWFEPGHSSLLEWLERTGDTRQLRALREVAECGTPLGRSRDRFLRRLRLRGLAAQVADAAGAPEHVRRASAHDAAVRLARRVADGGEAE